MRRPEVISAVLVIAFLGLPDLAQSRTPNVGPYSVKDVRRALATEGIALHGLDRPDRSTFARASGCPYSGDTGVAFLVFVCETSKRVTTLLRGASTLVLGVKPSSAYFSPSLHKGNVAFIPQLATSADVARLEQALAQLRHCASVVCRTP
jgi:hypothetical protein